MNSEPAPVDQLLQLGIHLAQQIHILWTYEHREAVHRIAAHQHANVRFFFTAGCAGNVVLHHFHLR